MGMGIWLWAFSMFEGDWVLVEARSKKNGRTFLELAWEVGGFNMPLRIHL